MMNLPQLPATRSALSQEIVELRGINWSDNYQPGDLADSLNISARRWPYITTRKGRTKQVAYANATALTSWNKLVVVQGTDLLYDDTVVGSVSPGEKQFAVVNTKLVIWPDKVYLDLTTMEEKSLGAEEGAGAGTAVFTTNSLQVDNVDFAATFRAGDGVTIAGCTSLSNNGTFTIRAISGDTMTFAENAFTAGTEEAAVTIKREIPDLDFICESENRLWGCSNATQTIYACALGDPTNWNVYDGIATDSYALAVGSAGDFTGCCKLSSSVLFWKENTLHKMLGSYPAEYSLNTYTVEGLLAGCNKSMQVISDVLYYMGLHGVYAYAGGTPQLISANFGERWFTKGAGGTDGDTYYLSCRDENEHWHMLAYETTQGIWVHEDNLECIEFTRLGRQLYFLTRTGDVYLADIRGDDPSLHWMVHFNPFYASVWSSKKKAATPERKWPARMYVRMELPSESWVQAFVRMDGGPWLQTGTVFGKETDVIDVLLPLGRCDKIELRMEGKGPCTILSMRLDYRMGSAR